MKIKIKNSIEFEEMLVRKGFSKRGLAETAEIGEATAIQIANGSRHPSPRTAKKITTALDCSFDDIFEIIKHSTNPG